MNGEKKTTFVILFELIPRSSLTRNGWTPPSDELNRHSLKIVAVFLGKKFLFSSLEYRCVVYSFVEPTIKCFAGRNFVTNINVTL